MDRKISINGKTYRFGFRTVWSPLYVYEATVGKDIPFDATRLLCMHLLYYCILSSGNDDFDLSPDEFLEALNDTELVTELNKMYSDVMEELTPVTGDDGGKNTAEAAKKKA